LVFAPGTPVAPPWAPVAGFSSASAKVLDSAKTVANAIVVSFMFVSSWLRGEQIALQSYVPPLAVIPPYPLSEKPAIRRCKIKSGQVPYQGGRNAHDITLFKRRKPRNLPFLLSTVQD
jgi:hypothetical protein